MILKRKEATSVCILLCGRLACYLLGRGRKQENSVQKSPHSLSKELWPAAFLYTCRSQNLSFSSSSSWQHRHLPWCALSSVTKWLCLKETLDERSCALCWIQREDWSWSLCCSRMALTKWCGPVKATIMLEGGVSSRTACVRLHFYVPYPFPKTSLLSGQTALFDLALKVTSIQGTSESYSRETML